MQQQAMRENSEGVTLDLSMRKKASPPLHATTYSNAPSQPHVAKIAPIQHPRTLATDVLVYCEGPSPQTPPYYHSTTPEQGSGQGKSPSQFMQDSRAPHLVMNRTLAPSAAQQGTQKISGHSTVVSPQFQYNIPQIVTSFCPQGHPPPLTPKLMKGGSITHGTPVSGGTSQASSQLLTPVSSAMRYVK